MVGLRADLVRSMNMNLEDVIPVLGGHLLKRPVPENTSIVDKHINTTKVIDGGPNDLVAIRNTVIVGYSGASSSFDLSNYLVSGLDTLYSVCAHSSRL